MTTQPNPLIQQAATMFQNPNAAAVPPASPGVIDPTQHPVIKAIIQALSTAAQGYSQTAMDPRERMQRQEMDAQKAEALARLGLSQQQLGLEGQRVGLEGERVGIERGRAEQEKTFQTGQLAESGKRTGIEQQRADQEKEAKDRELTMQEDKFKQEYGIGGLRSREVATQESAAKTAQGRLAAEVQMNKIIKDRDDAEAAYRQGSLRAQGLQTDRTALEDERKARYKVVDDTLDKHFWFYDSKEDLLAAKNAKHAEIDKDINTRLAQAEKGAGTGAGAGGWSGWKPGQPGGVLAQPGQNAGPTEFVRLPDGTIGPKPTGGKP